MPSSDLLVVLNKDEDTVTLYDERALDTLATIPVERNPHEVAITPDGQKAFVSNAGADSISVIDMVVLAGGEVGSVLLDSPGQDEGRTPSVREEIPDLEHGQLFDPDVVRHGYGSWERVHVGHLALLAECRSRSECEREQRCG